jgi:shikimate kinase
MKKPQNPATGAKAAAIRNAIGNKNVVLVGMMGAGKSSIGKRLAAELDIPFVDADSEIEAAANMTIPEIFETYGEDYFRDGERKVIARLLRDGPRIIATGGGAVADPETRRRIGRKSIAIWLKADVEILLERVKRRSNRPLLKADNPERVLRRLATEREPYYSCADITVRSHNAPHQYVVSEILSRLETCLNDRKRKKTGVVRNLEESR